MFFLIAADGAGEDKKRGGWFSLPIYVIMGLTQSPVQEGEEHLWWKEPARL